jgi:hypothetical protein
MLRQDYVFTPFILRHPGLPGVLRLSVNLRTFTPQDTWPRERAENYTMESYSYLAGMMTYTIYNVVCRSMTIDARYAASARIENRRLSPAVIWRSLRWQINRRVFGMSWEGHHVRFRIPVLDNDRVTRERLPSQPSNKWGVKTWVRERVLVSVLDVRDRRSRVGSTQKRPESYKCILCETPSRHQQMARCPHDPWNGHSPPATLSFGKQPRGRHCHPNTM